MKTTDQLYYQKGRLFEALRRNTTAQAKKAHPETGGNEHLIHNWGNVESKTIWTTAWARWGKIAKIYKDLYDYSDHMEHTAKFPDLRPSWCKYCN